MFTDTDVNYIMNLSRGEKAEKRIREFLNSSPCAQEAKEKRITFFNKTYKAFFKNYFGRYAQQHIQDCIMLAYTIALDRLQNGASLETALQDGMTIGDKIYQKELNPRKR